ncbi:MAG: DUF6525 family protein [Pseudomonadota bacterium]
MSGNLGHTGLRLRRRSCDPMQVYDGLPAPVRRWLADAALPWSPSSARRLWQRACAEGLSTDDALARLARAEIRSLARDRHAVNQEHSNREHANQEHAYREHAIQT